MLFPPALTLNEAGGVGVRGVKGGDMAQFVTVAVSVRDGAWGGGLPREATVIATGHDFTTSGQSVAPVGKGVQ